jgi:glycosyltransferase 2 family protein
MNPDKPYPPSKQKLGRIVLIGFTLLLTAYVLYKQDWGLFTRVITNRYGLTCLLLGILSMLVAQVIAAVRWLILLKKLDPTYPFSESLRLTLMGAFASNFLPSSVGGDVLRILGLDHRRISERVSVVVTDRVLSFLSVVLIIPFSLITLIPRIVEVLGRGIRPGGGMVAVSVPPFLTNLYQKGMDQVKGYLLEIIKWKNYPGILTEVVLLAVLNNLFGWLTMWLIVRGLGLNLSYPEVVALGIALYFTGLLPITINGLGFQEICYGFLFGLFGIAAAQGMTVGVLFRIVYLVALLPGGIWMLLSKDKLIYLRGKDKTEES